MSLLLEICFISNIAFCFLFYTVYNKNVNNFSRTVEFRKNMPLDGGCKQQIAISQPCTGSDAYKLRTYFIINIPRCGQGYVFDPVNSFLRFNAYNSDRTEVLHAENVLEVVDNYPP